MAGDYPPLFAARGRRPSSSPQAADAGNVAAFSLRSHLESEHDGENSTQELREMRAVLAYITLVGLPIFGILGVLQFGKSLRSSLSVAGDWRLELSPAWANGADCGRTRLSHAFTINVSQSGSALSFSVKDGAFDRLTGTIVDSQVSAVGAASSLRLRAEIDRVSKPDRMSGSITLAGCKETDRIDFVATRGTGPLRTTGGH